jgi:predicted phosphoribosyltransferase
MKTIFQDRPEAGRLLARRLQEYAGRPDVIVLALPRGGVPVAHAVAQALQVPLDVLVVRKLGVPGQEELAFGAIASGGVQVLNSEVVETHGLAGRTIAAVAERERRELLRRERAYRGSRPPPVVRGRIVILVDDGIATGATMRAALLALRHLGAATVVVAAPVIAPYTLAALQAEADRVVAVSTPDGFAGVGQWYEDFSQTTDGEVCALLAGMPAAD